jgi:hypothetical protein
MCSPIVKDMIYYNKKDEIPSLDTKLISSSLYDQPSEHSLS